MLIGTVYSTLLISTTYNLQKFGRKCQYRPFFAKRVSISFCAKNELVIFWKNDSYWPHLITIFTLGRNHLTILKFGMCRFLFGVIFLAKLYFNTTLVLHVLVQLFSFCPQVFSESFVLPFSVLLSFCTSSFSFQVPFSATISSPGSFQISSPDDSLSDGDEPMEISVEDEYVKTSSLVLWDTGGQADRIQRFDRADFST